MGAVTFSLDHGLVECLKTSLPLKIFVETGTYKGDTVAAMEPYFEEIHSVELSEPLWKESIERFVKKNKVKLHLGSSSEVLKKIVPLLGDTSILYWLDAHWCTDVNLLSGCSQCPLLDELRTIGQLGLKSVVLIDDARLFLSPPLEPHEVSQWPYFDQVVHELQALSSKHKLMVVNDVIAFYPESAHDQLVKYARLRGVDWLRARQSLEENHSLRLLIEEKDAFMRGSDVQNLISQLNGKEVVIQEQKEALRNYRLAFRVLQPYLSLRLLIEKKDTFMRESDVQNLINQLNGKEVVIQEQKEALRNYRLAFRVLQPYLMLNKNFLFRRLLEILRPRLGNLYQHPPYELVLPPSYQKTKVLNATPKISIVTPSYRQAMFIERTLRSVLDQQYPNLEYYVQDGASEDGTKEILEQYADRLAGWESKADGGQAQAINLGFSKTTGEIMAWLNSDDILLPGALAYVADYFNRNPEVDVVYGHRILIDEVDQKIGRWMLPAHDNKVLSWVDYIPQETLFWRRSIWNKVGAQIDESYRFAMDWDLLVRFRDAGAKFSRLPRFLGAFRIHGKQKTSALISEIGCQEMNKIRQRMLGKIPTGAEVRGAVKFYVLKHIVVDLSWRVKKILGVLS